MVRVATRLIVIVSLISLLAVKSCPFGVDDAHNAYIEHKVTLEEATKEAEILGPKLGNGNQIAGCGVCTTEEHHYCLGDSVINDHCCCDSRYLEWFSYLPHTCYLTRNPCKTVARDCEAYNRIRVCCCDQTTGRKWRSLLSAAPISSKHSWLPLIASLITTCIFM